MMSLVLVLLIAAMLVHGIAIMPGRIHHIGSHANLVSATDSEGGWKQVNLTKQYEFGTPPLPFNAKHLCPEATIVVLISSLRETRLANTLVSFFSKAKHPHRVHIAVVQQNAPEDEDVVDEYCRLMGTPCPYKDNIRVTRLLASEAKGPVYARALGNKLVDFSRDDFCMQIDAHTLVVDNWDVLLLEDWGRANNEFAVLTTYPSNSPDLGVNGGGHWSMPHLCCVNFDQPGILTNCQAKAAANLEAPLLAPLWAAGFSLSKCHAERAVPNDEKLVGVFAGEEYARGVRLWTHGYDFYSNTRPWIATYYGDEKGGKAFHWDESELKKSWARIRTLLRMPDSDQSTAALLALRGADLGTRRTLEQYIEFTGINPHVGKKHEQSPSRCAPVYVSWYIPPQQQGFLRKTNEAKQKLVETMQEASWFKWLVLAVCMLFVVLVVRMVRERRKRRQD